MLQLSERDKLSNKFYQAALIPEPEGEIVHERGCTDLLCLILFLGFFGVFIAFLIYGVVSGNPDQIFGVYNSDLARCSTTNFPYGFFPNYQSLTSLVCVKTCPANNQLVTCLTTITPNPSCPAGFLTSNYTSFPIGFLCVVDPAFSNGISFTSYLDFTTFTLWTYDAQKGYLVLIGAAVASILLSFIFLCFLRCCTKIVIWLSIALILAILVTLGVLMILQSQGISISMYLPFNLATLSVDTLIIVGSCLFGVALLFLLCVLCLGSRINLGSAIVETASIFLSENCFVIFLPIIQAIFFSACVAATIVGAIYLVSSGTITLASPFASVNLSTSIIVMISFFGVGALWTVFWVHGSNNFIISSATCIWYFNNEQYNRGIHGKPLADSFKRLLANHSGTVAFASLVFAVFWILRLIAQLFSFQNERTENKCANFCFKCCNFFLCLFNICLRFLSEGTYVQVAVKGTSYCPSTINSFNILKENSLKLSITDGVSVFVTIVGVLAITFSVAISAYFLLIYVPILATLETGPIPITSISAIISFVISSIYLSLIDVSAQSIIQCYFIDIEESKKIGMKVRYCPQTVNEVLLTYFIE